MKKGDKNIYLLGGSSLINDIGSDMISPLLPFYILSFGGGGVSIGAISGLREGLSSIMKLLGGWYGDRIGKRRMLVFLGYLTSAVFRFLLLFVSTASQIITFVSLERFGKLRDAPRDAIIADTTKKRGRGFGIHQMMDTSGAIIGSILVIIMFWGFGLSFKTIIFGAAAISTFSLLPLFFVKEKKIKPRRVSLFEGLHKLNNKLRYLIFVFCFFTLANFGLYLFILLIIRDVTGSIVISLLFYLAFNVFYAIFSEYFGKLSDKIGRKKVLMGGFILFFVVSLGFLFNANDLISLFILFSAYGLVMAATSSNQRAFVSDLSGKYKGTTLGYYYFFIGLTNILGGIIAGVLWNISPTVMFSYISVISALSIILLGFVKK